MQKLKCYANKTLALRGGASKEAQIQKSPIDIPCRYKMSQLVSLRFVRINPVFLQLLSSPLVEPLSNVRLRER